MNERIRELAEEAGAEIHGHPDYATICVNGQDADALMKKFAELIVRECAEFARQHNLEKADRSHMIHRAIKEHFGVEE